MKSGYFKNQCVFFMYALTFLTRIPVTISNYQPQLLAKSVVYFPVVGLLVGLLNAIAFFAFVQYWNASTAVILTMILSVLTTGGFHEDGLADSADGMGGGWSVDDKLRIMKDSRIGTYGSLALITVLLLKFSTLSSIAVDLIPAALICGHVLGRWSTLPLLKFCQYLGAREGTGSPLVDAVTNKVLLVASLFSGFMLLLLVPDRSFLIIIFCIVILFLCGLYFKAKLGGITGDTLGASNQLVEVGVYLAIAAHLA